MNIKDMNKFNSINFIELIGVLSCGIYIYYKIEWFNDIY